MPNTIDITVDEYTLKAITLKYLESKLGDIELKESDIKIETKSKQNFKSEWETAAFRASISLLI